MPQIKEMARKEGVARDKEKEKAEGKQIKADTVLQFLKDDQIKQKKTTILFLKNATIC